MKLDWQVCSAVQKCFPTATPIVGSHQRRSNDVKWFSSIGLRTQYFQNHHNNSCVHSPFSCTLAFPVHVLYLNFLGRNGIVLSSYGRQEAFGNRLSPIHRRSGAPGRLRSIASVVTRTPTCTHTVTFCVGTWCVCIVICGYQWTSDGKSVNELVTSCLNSQDQSWP